MRPFSGLPSHGLALWKTAQAPSRQRVEDFHPRPGVVWQRGEYRNGIQGKPVALWSCGAFQPEERRELFLPLLHQGVGAVERKWRVPTQPRLSTKKRGPLSKVRISTISNWEETLTKVHVGSGADFKSCDHTLLIR